MNNSNFLKNYQHLQYGIMYHKLIDLGFASIAWCKTYDSVFFNHAQVDQLINKQQLTTIETKLKSLSRKNAIYFENTDKLNSLKSFLTKEGYKKEWEDSWMFHNGQNIDENSLHEVRKVENKKQLEEFLSTFDKCYKKNDPQNPYGELGSYIDVARESWTKHHDKKIEYFTVFKDEKPVAVSTLTSFKEIGYISNVGSLKSVRGLGFGKTASLFTVLQSIKNNNKYHTLATEEGDYPNEFYKRIGFKKYFSAVGYVKKEV